MEVDTPLKKIEPHCCRFGNSMRSLSRKKRSLPDRLLCALFPSSFSFTPSDECLLNCGCGSSSNTTFFNHFSDEDFNSGSGFVSTGRSISVTNNKIPPPNSPSPYHTARVLTTACHSSRSVSNRIGLCGKQNKTCYCSVYSSEEVHNRKL